ncbi:MAG: SIR2 family protein [bacterium]
MNFRDNDIIFLLGAGASADAGIPVSQKMVDDIENSINSEEWKKYKDLYYLIKSGVQYSAGLSGKTVNFNIETLLFVLEELIQKENHLLYPFIGSWNVKFNEVIKDNFDLIKDFQIEIKQKLQRWVTPRDYRKADYFKNLKRLKDELTFPLRVFTLNYDRCIEENNSRNDYEFSIERGFEEEDANRLWNYKRFDEVSPETEPDIYLYKLHGSIDWERDEETKVVSCIDGTPSKADLIFGTQNKLQFADPYLYLFSAFRFHTLKAKLIICVGYSFSDDHINGLISQALKQNTLSKLLIATYDSRKQNDLKKEVIDILKVEESQIEIRKTKAKEFFEEDLKTEKLLTLFPIGNEDEDIL